MTLAIAIQNDQSRLMLALQFPAFRLNVLHFLIVALSLPVLGLWIEGIPQAGLLSLFTTAAGLGLVIGLLFSELAGRVKL